MAVTFLSHYRKNLAKQYWNKQTVPRFKCNRPCPDSNHKGFDITVALCDQNVTLVRPVQGQRLSETVLTRQQFTAILPVVRDEVHFVAVYVSNVCVPVSVAIHGDRPFDVMGLRALETVLNGPVVGHADKGLLGREEQQHVTGGRQGNVFGWQGKPYSIQTDRAQHLGRK